MIGFICVMSAGAYWRSQSVGNWFCFVTMTAFWTTGTLLVFYPLWSFFYFTAALDTAVNASSTAAFGAASFFGFVSMAVYGYDAFLKFSGWRAGQPAQGERTVQHGTTSHVQSPP